MTFTKYALIACFVCAASPAFASGTGGPAPAAPTYRIRGANINTNVNTNTVSAHGAYGQAGGPRVVTVRGFNNNTNINTNHVHIDLGLRAWGEAATAYWKAVGAFWGLRPQPQPAARHY